MTCWHWWRCPPVKSFMWIRVAINLILLPLKRELLSSKVCITGVPPQPPLCLATIPEYEYLSYPELGAGEAEAVTTEAATHAELQLEWSMLQDCTDYWDLSGQSLTIYFMLYCVHAGLQDNIYYLLYLHIWRHFNYVFWFGQMIDNNSLTIRFVVYLIQ